YDNSLQVVSPKTITSPSNSSQVDLLPVYEDQNILIVVKDHGISMTELDKATKYYFYQQNPSNYQKLSEKYFVFTALHRLDKLTKGLVIYPKNPNVKKILYQA